MTISPYGDIFVLRGQPLSLACTISSKKASLVSVYSLSIALNYACNNTAPTQYLSYDTDRKSVTLNIPKASLRDDRTYFCCYDGHMETFKTVYVGGNISVISLQELSFFMCRKHPNTELC